MKEQNYSNHKQYVIGFHFITFSIIVLLLALSLYSVIYALKYRGNIVGSIMFLFTSVSLISLFFYLRVFALRAQDRAIRAEENLRHFVLTGKLLDSNLRMSQILALRFADDHEFPGLAGKAVSDNLSSDDIKKSVTKWKADHHRV